jgi:hypothetical protein
MSALSGRDRAAALELLGLQAGATREQITRAYRRLARVTHPDVTGATDPAAGDRFAAISDAYHRLAATPSPRPTVVPRPVRRPTQRPTQGPTQGPTQRPVPGPGWTVGAGWARPPIVAGPVVITPLVSSRRPGEEARDGR